MSSAYDNRIPVLQPVPGAGALNLELAEECFRFQSRNVLDYGFLSLDETIKLHPVHFFMCVSNSYGFDMFEELGLGATVQH